MVPRQTSAAGPKRRASTLGSRRLRDALSVARHVIDFVTGPGTPARTLDGIQTGLCPVSLLFWRLANPVYCFHAVTDPKGKHCWSRSGTAAAWGLARTCRQRQARSREGARGSREWGQNSQIACCRWPLTRASPRRQQIRKEIVPSDWCWSRERPAIEGDHSSANRQHKFCIFRGRLVAMLQRLVQSLVLQPAWPKARRSSVKAWRARL